MTDDQITQKEYTCQACGKKFNGTWSDEDAAKEFQENFGRPVIEDDAVICDDCYQKLMPIIKN